MTKLKASTVLRAFLLGSGLVLSLGYLSPLSAQPKPQLQLTAEIIEQRYCSVDSDSMSLQVRLRLRYTNLGSQKLIVYRGHDLFFQTRIRSVPAGDVKPYEIVFLNSHYFDEEFELIDAPLPSKVFAMLAPGAFLERELVVGIGVVGDAAGRSNASVKAGPHMLQVIVSTWYQSLKLAEKLRQQWERKGVLWFQPLFSMPLNFAIAKPASLTACR